MFQLRESNPRPWTQRTGSLPTASVGRQYVLTYCPQLICELSLLLSASGIGLYYRALTERAHRNTFAGTRTCLEQRVKLECEREQQESLLLSVIPAYIAAE
ncbi:jg7531, partial [Pararge aegeria aegeria]